MPEVTAGRIPGAGGALFLKRRKPFRERLGQGLAGAAQTIGGGLMQRAQQEQLLEQRQQQQGQAQLLQALPGIIEMAGENPAAATAALQAISQIAQVEAPQLDFEQFRTPEPSPGEQLQQFAPGVLSGTISPEQLGPLAETFGIPTTVPTGTVPEITDVTKPHPAVPDQRAPIPELGALQQVGRLRPQEPPKLFQRDPAKELREEGTGRLLEGAVPEPEKPQERYRVIGGTLFDMQTMQPVFTSPSAPRGPGPRRVIETEGKQQLIDENGNVIAEFGAKPERQDPLMQLLTGGGGAQALAPQPSHEPAQESGGIMDTIRGLFGGREQPAAPSQRPIGGDGAAEQLLRSQGVPVTPKNLELAREQLRRRSGAQR